jgi:hypothetical protein
MKRGDRRETDTRMPNDVDSQLLRGLQPDPEVVDRVIRRSLAAHPHATKRSGVRLWRLAAGTAAVFLALLAVLIVLVGDGPSQDRMPGAKRDRQIPIISNSSGRVVLLRHGRSVSPETVGVVHRENGPRRPVVFNSDGLICAALPGGMPRYLLLGGKS